MNFYKLNTLIQEEITPDQSGVSEPANDKTVSNMLDMMKGLLDKVGNDALKAKIKKFIDEMTGTEKNNTPDNKEKPSQASSSGPQEKPSEGPMVPPQTATAPAAQPADMNAPASPPSQPMPPAMPAAGPTQ